MRWGPNFDRGSVGAVTTWWDVGVLGGVFDMPKPVLDRGTLSLSNFEARSYLTSIGLSPPMRIYRDSWKKWVVRSLKQGGVGLAPVLLRPPNQR